MPLSSAISGPEPPLVDSVDTKTTEALIQLFPPDSDDITYLTNYSLTSKPDVQFSKSFTQPTIALTDLNAGSEYNIFIFTVFNGVYSNRPCHLTVKTLASFTKDFGHSASLVVSSLPTVSPSSTSASTESGTSSTITTTVQDSTVAVEKTSTLPPMEPVTEPGLPPTTTTSTSTVRSTEHVRTILIGTTTSPLPHAMRHASLKESTGGSSWKPGPAAAVRRPGIPEEATEESETIPVRPQEHSPADSSPGRKALLGAIGREHPHQEEDGEESAAEEQEGSEGDAVGPRPGVTANKKSHAKLVKPVMGKRTDNLVFDTVVTRPFSEEAPKSSQSYNFTSSLPPEIMAKLPDSYGRPKSVEFSPEGRQLRLSWRSPDGVDCSGYLVNYTLTTLHVPKSFQILVNGDRMYAFIKMYLNNIIQASRFDAALGYLVLRGEPDCPFRSTYTAFKTRPSSVKRRVE